MTAETVTLGGKRFVIIAEKDYRRLKAKAAAKPNGKPRHAEPPGSEATSPNPNAVKMNLPFHSKPSASDWGFEHDLSSHLQGEAADKALGQAPENHCRPASCKTRLCWLPILDPLEV